MAAIPVPSLTEPGVVYDVRIDPVDGTILDCECSDYIYRRRVCKHQRLLAQHGEQGVRRLATVAVRYQEQVEERRRNRLTAREALKDAQRVRRPVIHDAVTALDLFA